MARDRPHSRPSAASRRHPQRSTRSSWHPSSDDETKHILDAARRHPRAPRASSPAFRPVRRFTLPASRPIPTPPISCIVATRCSAGEQVAPAMPEFLGDIGSDSRRIGDANAAWLCPSPDSCRPSADGTRDRQPRLAAPLWCWSGRYTLRFRKNGNGPVASRTSGLAGSQVRRRWLVAEETASPDPDIGDLSPIECASSRSLGDRRRLASSLAFPTPSP